MKICGFLQMYNEVEKGNLENCLINLKEICEDIVIYDSGSTDNSVEIASRYTNHIILGTRDFLNEISHKAELLEYAQKNVKPDWFLWLDADEIIDRAGLIEIPKLCLGQADGFEMQEITLWRSNFYKRIDSNWDTRWFPRLWRNTPTLCFKNIKTGLHQPQWPVMKNILRCNAKVIHFGYATYENICSRYVERINMGVNEIDRDNIIEEERVDVNHNGVILKLQLAEYPSTNFPESFLKKPNILKYCIYPDKYSKENYLCNDSDDFIRGHIYHEIIKENMPFINRNVIHLGCNRGQTTNLMSKYFDVQGLDINKKAIDLARQSYPHITFHNENIAKMPFKEDTFNGAYMLDVFEHLYPEDINFVLHEIKRIIIKGSYVFILVPRATSDKDAAFIPEHKLFFKRKETLENYFKKYFSIIDSGYEQRTNPSGVGQHDAVWLLVKK